MTFLLGKQATLGHAPHHRSLDNDRLLALLGQRPSQELAGFAAAHHDVLELLNHLGKVSALGRVEYVPISTSKDDVHLGSHLLFPLILRMNDAQSSASRQRPTMLRRSTTDA